MARFVDLSIAIENNEHSDPPGFSPKVTYVDHAAGARQLVASFPGLTPEDLPEGQGWAVETIQLSTHNGPTWTPPGTSTPPRTRRWGRSAGP